MNLKLITITTAVAAALSTSAFAYNQSPVQSTNNIYVRASGGIAIPRDVDTDAAASGIYSSSAPLKTGYDFAIASGYTFKNIAANGDGRIELQYLRIDQAYSDNLQKLLTQYSKQGLPGDDGNPPQPLNGTVPNAAINNSIMLNAIYDWNITPQFTTSFGLGVGYAHLSALINNVDNSALNSYGQKYFNAQNDIALSLIVGAQWNIQKNISLGVIYNSYMVTTNRAGEYTDTYTDGSSDTGAGVQMDNIFNLSATYRFSINA